MKKHKHKPKSLINIEEVPLEWYVERLERKEYFAFPRYGDGEWRAILRGTGIVSAHLQLISKEIQAEMIRDLIAYAGEPQVIFSLQHYARKVFGKSIEKFLHNYKLENISWVDAGVFHYASRDGLLYPLIEQLRKMKIVVVGPNFLRKIKENVFDYCAFVEVPEKNCYSEKDDIESRILDAHQAVGRNTLYSFSCGLLAETLIFRMHEKMPKNFLIDFGSLWDVFCGRRSRRYMDKEKYPSSRIYKNLGLRK